MADTDVAMVNATILATLTLVVVVSAFNHVVAFIQRNLFWYHRPKKRPIRMTPSIFAIAECFQIATLRAISFITSLVLHWWLMLQLKALETILQGVNKNRTKEHIETYRGTLDVHDAMNDHLIAEALSVGISVNEIAHALFTCEESIYFLRDTLNVFVQLNDEVQEQILNVLQKGRLVDCREYTNVLLICETDLITTCDDFIGEELDISTDYIRLEKNKFYIERVATAYQYKNGVYRIDVGKTKKWAIVPYEKGVYYYRHKAYGTQFVNTSGKVLHLAQATVDNLVELGCADVIAWRLLTAIVLDQARGSTSSMNADDFFATVVQSFKIISGFRSEIQTLVQESKYFGKKMLTNDDLHHTNRGGTKKSFALDKTLYLSAQRRTSLYCDTRGPQCSLKPFTATFLSINATKTYTSLLENIILKAKRIFLKKGIFNDREELVFEAMTKRKKSYHSSASGASASVRESIKMPFSNLVLFASKTSYDKLFERGQLLEGAGPEQSLDNTEVSLNNWIALRAALDFDIYTKKFSYGMTEFERTNKLVSENLVTFIQDTTPRFKVWFDSLPNTIIYTSYLIKLCDMVAERTGASSPWLVREIVSRCIALGAKAVSGAWWDGTMSDSYGQMERKVKEMTMEKIGKQLPDSDKVLFFDRKVFLRGIRCHVLGDEGRVLLLEADSPNGLWQAELQFLDQTTRTLHHPPDSKTAMKWLDKGKRSIIVFCKREAEHHKAPPNNEPWAEKTGA